MRFFHQELGVHLPGENHHQPLTYSRLKALPKIDLHRHLEGSLRLGTLAEIALENNMDLPHLPGYVHLPGYDKDTLRPYVQVTNDPPSAKTFLAKFKILRRFYQSPEAIYRLAYEAVADAAADNVRYLELRFSPQALAKVRGFAYSDVTDWVMLAADRAAQDFAIHVGLIITLVRHDPLKSARKVAEIAFERHNTGSNGRSLDPDRGESWGIVGLDLAGDEVHYPMTPFREIFQEAQQLGMGITVHAGEWSGAETVEEAITALGAARLGHGVRAVENSRTIKLVRERSITLEICLTSNIQTGVVHDITHHPLIDLLDLNVLATLNTDDPSVSDCSLTNEYQIAVETLNLDYTALRQMALNAASAAFLPPAQRRELKSYFEYHLPENEHP
jgi:adenosine deaminase